mgnify:CR=1 FL=1
MAKSKNKSDNQLNIHFESSNAFAEQLRGGKFTIVVECDSPATGQPFESGVAMARNLAEHARGLDSLTALSVSDRLQSEDRYDPARVGEILAAASGKPVIMHLSGKGSSMDRIRELLSEAASTGIQNILAVTGDRSDKHPRPHALNRSPRYTEGYVDSVEIVRRTTRNGHKTLIGAGVNPFKYNPADQYLQYYKMMRKINTGAQFIVANFGWDMKKLQEMQWYLQMRDVGVPVLARAGLLNPAEIAALGDNVVPGVPISRSLASLLQRESNINATQSLAAQLQRLSLQIVGARFLGYSGVQLTGIRDPKTLDMVLKRVDEASTALSTYSDWVAAWNDHHGEMSFAPSANAYYVFQNLLDPGRQMYNESECPLTDREFPAPSKTDRIRALTVGRMLSPKAPGLLREIALKIWCRECTGEACRLEYSHSLCPKPCPKRLVYGACGGSQADGTCEFGHQPCFFHRVLALAAVHHDFDRLEEGAE